MRWIHPFDEYRLAMVAGPDGAPHVPPTDGEAAAGSTASDLFAGIRPRP